VGSGQLLDRSRKEANEVTKGQKYPAEVLDRAEIDALLRACGRSRTGRRNRALIVLLWRAGLRISEALALEPRDVNFERGTVRVRRGKGSRARTVGLDPQAAAVLEQWLQVRSANAHSLISTLDGSPVQASYVRAALPRLARRAGISKRVHAHGLRHAYAYELIEEGASPVHVRDLLGHSNIATTDRYLRSLGASQAVAFARERTWEAESAT
jgi:site-specific recombinase XerD